jgi:hypothetical protein
LRVQRYARFLRRHGRVAEYGCGTVPITTALARHYRHLDLELVAAGIPHVLFHFVRWRFRDVPYVTTVPITPADDATLPGRYDAIFCLETLEHLPRPLAAAPALSRRAATRQRPGSRLHPFRGHRPRFARRPP